MHRLTTRQPIDIRNGSLRYDEVCLDVTLSYRRC
jgi:hypothetical protein